MQAGRQDSGEDVKIGTAKGGSRGIFIVAGGVVAMAAVVAFYVVSSSSDAPKLKALEDFRWAFAKKCDAEEFRGETPPYVRDEYLRSPRLQEAVAKQAALLSGDVACADIDRALRTASFPMSARH